MTAGNGRNGDFRFAEFEVDASAHELRKGGVKVHLEVQPFQVLLTLLERQGEVVTREELKQALWPDDTFVDFDNGVNQAISKIRNKLNDSAKQPRFVETIPRVGYRFVGRIDYPATEPPVPTRRHWIGYAATGLVGVAAGAGIHRFGTTEPQVRGHVRRFTIQPDDPVRLSYRNDLSLRNVAVAPNGRYLAFIGSKQGQLWMWDLRRGESRPLQGVTDASGPFWSSDSEFVLFASRATGRMHKALVRDGSVSSICEIGRRGIGHGTVSNDGSVIVYTTAVATEVWEVPFDGGTPEPVFSQEEKYEIFAESFAGGHTPLGMFPTFLPSEAGERVLLFGAGRPNSPAQRMMILDMKTRQRKTLAPGLVPAYSSTGHLIYAQGRNPVHLWALAFSLRTLDVDGKPFIIAQNAWQHSLAQDGTLVYLNWKANPNRLVWRDRSGKELGSIGHGERPTISPDGSRVAFHIDGDIWAHDLDRGKSRTVTADQAGDAQPVWSPDGQRLAFASSREGPWDIWMIDVDRAGEKPVRITSSPFMEIPYSWSRDGKYLLYHRQSIGGHHDLFFLTHHEQPNTWASHEFLATDHREGHPRLSPDGRYVAYLSYVSGQAEVYVERFPQGGGRIPVSAGEARVPRWRPDGKELFYGTPRGLVALNISTERDFSFGKPSDLFDWVRRHNGHDVSADGQRFLISEAPEGTPEIPIQVIENWYEEISQ